MKISKEKEEGQLKRECRCRSKNENVKKKNIYGTHYSSGGRRLGREEKDVVRVGGWIRIKP